MFKASQRVEFGADAAWYGPGPGRQADRTRRRYPRLAFYEWWRSDPRLEVFAERRRFGCASWCGIGEWIERDQIEFARHVANQRRKFPGLLGSIVDMVEHHVLERDEVARRVLD